jgi:uncharacterized protein (DUF1499 family)
MTTFLLSLLLPINDITTSLEAPPGFKGQEIEAFDQGLKERHQRLYPDLKPIELHASPEAVFSSLKEWIKSRDDWELSYEDKATQIEWIATTEVMNFKDDVVVRIENLGQTSAEGPQSKIHVRSKSRVGKSDLTANAKRIKEVLNFLIKNTRATPKT